jgi:hypothetical protein
MKTTILLTVLSLISSSCATLLNSKTDSIKVVTNEPSILTIDNCTLPETSNLHLVRVERSKDSIEISAFSDHNNKTINISAKNSFAYWLNLYPSIAWTGFLIDNNNPKRYSYPNTVYIALNDNKNTYLTYRPLDSVYSKYTNILKVTPLKAVSTINSGVEISYEKRVSNSFSTQLAATYLFPASIWDLGNDFMPQIKGFRVAVEEKYYMKRSAPLGQYISLEFNYLKNNYQAIGRFGVADVYSDTTYNDTNYDDTIRIDKNTYSFHLKIGYQHIRKRFSIDFFAGVGVRYKDVVHSDRLKPDDDMEMPMEPNVYYITNQEGQYWTISIPLNIRLGWTF